jgi:hypothetical protein
MSDERKEEIAQKLAAATLRLTSVKSMPGDAADHELRNIVGLMLDTLKRMAE